MALSRYAEVSEGSSAEDATNDRTPHFLDEVPSRDNHKMARRSDLLVIEKSQLRDGLWRFGRADEPSSTWGFIERNDFGGVEVTRSQGWSEAWRDDRATALCLVATHPDETRIEYDLSWRPVEGPLYRSEPVRDVAPVHSETLGERAARARQVPQR